MSTFLVLHTPVTSAPSAFAICTANVPTPPDAPLIRTFCTGRTCPLSRRPWRAVTAGPGAAAAPSHRHVRRLRDDRLADAHVLRERAVPRAEHRVPRPDVRDVLAD